MSQLKMESNELVDVQYLRAEHMALGKKYLAALPIVKKSDYMGRASLGQTFGAPLSKGGSKNLSDKLLNVNLNNYTSVARSSPSLYRRGTASYTSLETTANMTSTPVYNNSNSMYRSPKASYM